MRSSFVLAVTTGALALTLPATASAQLGGLVPVVPVVSDAVAPVVQPVVETVVQVLPVAPSTVDPVTNVVSGATGAVSGTLDSATGQITDSAGTVVGTVSSTGQITDAKGAVIGVISGSPAAGGSTTAPPPQTTPASADSSNGAGPANAASDRRAPALSLKAVRGQKARTVRAKGLRTVVSCDEACVVVIYVVAGRGAGRKIIGAASASLPANRSRTLTIKLTAEGRRTVSTRRSSKIAFVGLAADSARNRGTLRSRTAALSVPRKKTRR